MRNVLLCVKRVTLRHISCCEGVHGAGPALYVGHVLYLLDPGMQTDFFQKSSCAGYSLFAGVAVAIERMK